MTKEQEATEYLKQFSELMKKWDAIEISSNIETVLSMLKEKDEEIESLKEIKKIADSKITEFRKILDYDKLQSEIWILQTKLKEKNKMINEMAKYIDSNNYVDNEECQFQWDFKIEKCIGNGDCKDCIKQYYERKSKE